MVGEDRRQRDADRPRRPPPRHADRSRGEHAQPECDGVERTAGRVEPRRKECAEDDDHLEGSDLSANAYPSMAKRTKAHAAYATASTRSRHSPPGVFLPTTLVVCGFRRYRQTGTQKLRPPTDDSYE